MEQRIVPDMTLLSKNDYLQLRLLVAEFGAEYIANAAKHIEYIEKLKGGSIHDSQ